MERSRILEECPKVRRSPSSEQILKVLKPSDLSEDDSWLGEGESEDRGEEEEQQAQGEAGAAGIVLTQHDTDSPPLLASLYTRQSPQFRVTSCHLHQLVSREERRDSEEHSTQNDRTRNSLTLNSNDYLLSSG